jgi:hypothetical protein
MLAVCWRTFNDDGLLLPGESKELVVLCSLPEEVDHFAQPQEYWDGLDCHHSAA